MGQEIRTREDSFDVLERPSDWEKYAEVSGDIKELTTRKAQVAYILNRFPSTRNSDKELWLKHIEIFHDVNPDEALLAVAGREDLTSQNTVSRARAELQNRYRLYLPTRPEVIFHRQRKRKAYEASFLHLDEMDDESFTETYLYCDESGVTDRYLIFGFFLFLSGREHFEFIQKLLASPTRDGSNKRPYYHFKELRPRLLEQYLAFVETAIERPSARAHLHIFDLHDVSGPQTQVLARTLDVATVTTVRSLLNKGVIDEKHRIKLIPDNSQDQLFYREVENRLEPQFVERRLSLLGVEPTSSNVSYPTQVADILCSSVGRRLNSPNKHAKDELAAKVLDRLGIEDPLLTGSYGNVEVTNHGRPQSP